VAKRRKPANGTYSTTKENPVAAEPKISKMMTNWYAGYAKNPNHAPTTTEDPETIGYQRGSAKNVR
jgi:hypothetical protein